MTLEVRTSIAVEPRRIGATPSEPLAFAVTVTNDTGRYLRYAATLAGLDGAAVSSSPGELELGPGERGSFQVSARLPAVFPAGCHIAGIEVRSSDPGAPLVGFAEIEVDVRSVAGVGLRMGDPALRGRFGKKVDLLLHNGGSGPLSFRFEGHSPERRLRFRFHPETVTIEAGESSRVRARVSGRPRPVGSPLPRAFDIVAQGPSGQVTTSGTFTHKALVPTGFFKLLLVVAVLVVLVFAIQMMVRRFIIDSPDISWQRLSTGDTELAARTDHGAVWVEFPRPTADRPLWRRVGTSIADWFSGRGRFDEGMIVWGGTGAEGEELGTGALYRARDGQWLLLPDLGAPSARTDPGMVWTGETVVVWGGRTVDGDDEGDRGAEFNPATQRWAALPPGPLDTRSGHSMTWTGTELVVFGGIAPNGAVRDDGAVLTPGELDPAEHPDAEPGDVEQELSGGRWSPTPEFPGPPRHHHTATWTGTHLVIMGGYGTDGVPLADAYSYDPSNRTWTDISRNPPPEPRACHLARWTGSEIILLGGTALPLGDDPPCSPVEGLSADPDAFLLTPSQSDEGSGVVTTWEWSRPEEPPPEHLGTDSVGLWTANELTLIQHVPHLDTVSAARYTPSGGTENLPLPDPGTAAARTGFTGVWNTGGIVLWGGIDLDDRVTSDGALLHLPDR